MEGENKLERRERRVGTENLRDLLLDVREGCDIWSQIIGELPPALLGPMALKRVKRKEENLRKTGNKMSSPERPGSCSLSTNNITSVTL